MLSPDLPSFVALDVEISSRSPMRICAVAAVGIQSGNEIFAFRSLVHASGRVHYSAIHGLRASDLTLAPRWTVVWPELAPLLAGHQPVVAFRAAFDRGAVLTMCGRDGLKLPPLRFACAAEMARARLDAHLDLVSTMHRLGLPFPGTPHDPLCDARAAAAIAVACAPWPASALIR
jgi:DNA polymerase III epsilon subunit-like protein